MAFKESDNDLMMRRLKKLNAPAVTPVPSLPSKLAKLLWNSRRTPGTSSIPCRASGAAMQRLRLVSHILELEGARASAAAPHRFPRQLAATL